MASMSSVSTIPSARGENARAPGMSTLEIANLGHSWKGRRTPVFHNVSLTAYSGEVTWIGGANGAGKTTLLRLAAGILLPQQGSVSIERLASASGRPYRKQIGFLSAGDRSLQARMQVAQQLDYWARLAYVPREQRQETVDRGLEQFALRELADRRVDRISMGQRQRVRLAMAFMHEPRVVLLDEPRNSLDDDGYRLLNAQIELAAARGGTVVWCSPKGEDLVLACDRGYSLQHGHLEQVR